MRISPDELGVIISGLRIASVESDRRAKEHRAQGRFADAASFANLSLCCAELSNRLEREGTSREGSGFFIPKIN